MATSSAHSKWARVLAWFAIPALFLSWGALGLRGSWYYYDEWSLIHSELTSNWGQALFYDFNGHWWSEMFLLYRVQVLGPGLDHHYLVECAFLASLVGLQLALAFVLRSARVPLFTSVLLGGLLAYLPGAVQNSSFVVQCANNTVYVLGLVALGLILRGYSSFRSAIAVGALLLVAVPCDSGTALSMILLTTCVACMKWRDRRLLAIVPALVTLGSWYLWGDLGATWPGTPGHRVVVVGHLIISSLGALVGAPLAMQVPTGLVVMVLLAALLVGAHRAGLIRGDVRALLVGGFVAAGVTVIGIAQARGGLLVGNFNEFNRYLVQIDIPLVIALAPLAMAVARTPRVNHVLRLRPFMRGAAPVVIAFMFLIGVLNLHDVLLTPFQQSGARVKHDVASAALIIQQGCPSGMTMMTDALPASMESPQITVALLQELLRRGKLTITPGVVMDPVVQSRICRLDQ